MTAQTQSRQTKEPTAMRMVSSLVVLAVGLAAPSFATAQDEPYPSRPVRLIAAAGPGGNPDVLGRLLAEKFTSAMGKPFVVENMPGAGGVVAANLVAKAPPDGHVLMLGDSGALAINAALNPNLTYHPVKDFTPITALVTLPTIMVSHPSVPADTLAEFIALAKKEPGKLSYGSAGPGSIHHLTMAIFADRAGIELLHVPYRGGSAMVNGLLAGEITAGWSGIPNVMELIAAGRLRAYCVSTLQRSPSVPAVPTCDEVGQKGFDIATMMGLQAPAGAPTRVVARLQAETAKAMREPAMAARMTQLGMVMQENGTAHYTRFMQDDLERYAQAVKKLNLQIR
jgi:tripartite-type tricarboxylate transporter receptor subunit TctC